MTENMLLPFRNNVHIYFLRMPNKTYSLGVVSHDSLISLRIANRIKQIMVDYGLFFGHFERIANSKYK